MWNICPRCWSPDRADLRVRLPVFPPARPHRSRFAQSGYTVVSYTRDESALQPLDDLQAASLITTVMDWAAAQGQLSPLTGSTPPAGAAMGSSAAGLHHLASSSGTAGSPVLMSDSPAPGRQSVTAGGPAPAAASPAPAAGAAATQGTSADTPVSFGSAGSASGDPPQSAFILVGCVI